MTRSSRHMVWFCEYVKIKEFYIGERRNLERAYKRLSYSSYCQLVLWWNLNFLHDIRACWPMCNAQRLHMLCVTRFVFSMCLA